MNEWTKKLKAPAVLHSLLSSLPATQSSLNLCFSWRLEANSLLNSGSASHGSAASPRLCMAPGQTLTDKLSLLPVGGLYEDYRQSLWRWPPPFPTLTPSTSPHLATPSLQSIITMLALGDSQDPQPSEDSTYTTHKKHTTARFIFSLSGSLNVFRQTHVSQREKKRWGMDDLLECLKAKRESQRERKRDRKRSEEEKWNSRD